ncbi:hypothetical protein A1O3_06093 [Capronia epimyces CBS 606.96]|uniref:Uncharacterized protein n=1 Tax=Capronia epimyces CBS 606.96 TaxID=1182542 RepID=W9XY18_9EURO|nr:uncharacterized protein A1O3_06093 [Capronia epimyces CBS 606.96]EXJ82280.1 hypothetical protein A1O3_06093 [Capronia epimyces CBS 606.96]
MDAAAHRSRGSGNCQLSNEDLHRGAVNRNEHPISAEALANELLTADGQVLSVCSQKYLTLLVLEFLRAKAFPLVKLGRRHDWAAQIHRVQFLETEISRLFQNPDLFPSPASRARFAAMIALDGNLQFIQAVKDLLLRESAREIAQYSRDKLTHTSYLYGSKGWENFFLNMAPGAPELEKRMVTIPKSSFQIVPAVGMRFIVDNKAEERVIARWIREAQMPVEVQRASTTRLIDLDMEDDDEPHGVPMLSQQPTTMYSRPNPFKEHLKIRLDLPIQEPEPLEDYTPFLGRLESAPLPANLPGGATMVAPNIFPMVGVRSWHRPTRPWELRHYPWLVEASSATPDAA